MTAKEFLRRAYTQLLRVKDVEGQAAMMRGVAEQNGAVQYGERVSGSRNMTAGEDAIIRLMEMDKKVQEAKVELLRLQSENAELINRLESTTQREILGRRYIAFESWDSIACKMCYSRRWVFRMHNAAIANLEKVVTKSSLGGHLQDT